MNQKGFATIVILVILMAVLIVGGAYWYFHGLTERQVLRNSLSTSTNQEVVRATSSVNSGSYSYGIANCLLLATSTGVSGYPVVTSSYSLYDSTSTGISFCYPSDVTIGIPLHFANPPSQILWASGAKMSIEFPQSVNRGASAIANLLANCLASGNTEDACIVPQSYQIIHAINQNGLNYYIFWTDWEDNVSGIFNTSTGPFAYVATPGDPTLFIPEPLGNVQYTPRMLRDLIVIFNTLTVSRPL